MPRRRKELGTSLAVSGGACGVSRGSKDKPIQRNAANARERARMRILSR